MTKILNVYSPYSFHDEAYLVGNREGLVAMRDAINRALENSKPLELNATSVVQFGSDGEEYSTVVICDDSDLDSPTWQHMHTPYTADHASTEGLSELLWPADFLTDVQYRKLVGVKE